MADVAAIGNVNVDNTYFDLKDKNAALAEGREKALQDAKAKAEQLAKASGRKLGRVLTIMDNTYYNIMPINHVMTEGLSMLKGVSDTAATSTSFSPGETEVTVNVNVVYKIK